jgi:hypothetical protein
MKKRERPSTTPDVVGKCTPALRKQFVDLARQGVPDHIICNACKITQKTWIDWKHRANAGIEPFCSFVQDVTQAKAENGIEMIDLIKQHIKKRQDPKYGLKYLEVLHNIQSTPRTKKVEVSAEVQVSPAFDTSRLTDEEFQQWSVLVEKMKPGGVVLPVQNQEPHLIDSGLE